jgi:diaminopimelate decarboxylase
MASAKSHFGGLQVSDCPSFCVLQLDMVLRLGVPTERIVFANACKRPRDIRHAAEKQVHPCLL